MARHVTRKEKSLFSKVAGMEAWTIPYIKET